MKGAVLGSVAAFATIVIGRSLLVDPEADMEASREESRRRTHALSATAERQARCTSRGYETECQKMIGQVSAYRARLI